MRRATLLAVLALLPSGAGAHNFTLTDVQLELGADGTYTVQGNLTLHGVTKAVAIKMKKTGEGDDPWNNHRIGYEGMMKFSRSDFGMDKMPQAVGDEVWVTVAVEGIRK